VNHLDTRHFRRHAAATFGLIVALLATPSPAQPRDERMADASQQRDAERLQRCIESQLAPWQVESTASTDGRVGDTVRVTRWGNAPKVDCSNRVRSSEEHCQSPGDLQRVVRLEFDTGEAHPAWSANDRARLEDLIPTTLENIAGNVQLQYGDPRSAEFTGEILRVRLDYRGMSALQRDVDEWIRGPRELQVTLTLVDPSRRNRVLAVRTVTLQQSPQFRERYASTSSTRWMRQLLERIEATANDVLAPVACDTPWLDVTADRGKMWLNTGRYTGLHEGHSVLLVPTTDSALASRWPIARIRTLVNGSRAELEITRGSRDLCELGCRAILL